MNLKHVLAAMVLVACMAAEPAHAQQPAPPQLGATSYILMDFHSGEAIAGKAPEERVEPASITKLMTS